MRLAALRDRAHMPTKRWRWQFCSYESETLKPVHFLLRSRSDTMCETRGWVLRSRITFTARAPKLRLR
jgi:hypothetical protein